MKKTMIVFIMVTISIVFISANSAHALQKKTGDRMDFNGMPHWFTNTLSLDLSYLLQPDAFTGMSNGTEYFKLPFIIKRIMHSDGNDGFRETISIFQEQRAPFAPGNMHMHSGSPVPEPATFLLLGSGLFGIAYLRRHRRH